MFEKLKIQTQKNLNKDVIEYLKQRGIKKETAKKWGIGFLPSEKTILELEGDKDIFYKTGILLSKIDKTPLKQYITFPMYDQYGDIIGFSGRPPLENSIVKQKGIRKYWHSVFNKRSFLFGLNFAKEKAKEMGYIIVVEGQFDTITLSQSGIENVVSTCGTALTENQIILLSRYVDQAYVVFDNDEAGQRAFKQLSKYNYQGMKLKAIVIPDSGDNKEDPDSFVRKYGKDKFLEIIMKEESNEED